MQQMSTADGLILAEHYASFAEELVNYQSDHGEDEDVNQSELATILSAITQHSRTLANEAAATAFNDSAGATQQLQKSTASAVVELATLTNEVKQYTRVASIATCFVNLGIGLALKNPTATLKAAASLVSVLSKKS